MKKEFWIIINFILIFLLFFLKASFALTAGSVYISSNKEIIEKGEEIEITLSIENIKTSAFTAYLYFDDAKLEYVSGPENTNTVGNRIIFVWYDEKGGNGSKDGELATFRFKAKEDGLATFNIEGEFYSSQEQLIQTDFKEVYVQIGKEQTQIINEIKEKGTSTQSYNATLQSLRLGVEGLTPNFEKNINEYYLTIPTSVNDIEVLAVSENQNATIEITGNTNLKEGLNVINISVTSEDKTQKNIYRIQVTKTANIELANTNLETLAIENTLLNPPFDANVTHYKAEVSNDTTNLNVFAVSENEKGNVGITGKDDLKEGDNLIRVAVTAENGFSQKVYEVTVYKRNQEEEIRYREEQEENKEKLEDIYQVQKISSQSEETLENKKIKEQDRLILIVVIAIIVILGLTIVIFRYKKKRGHFLN